MIQQIINCLPGSKKNGTQNSVPFRGGKKIMITLTLNLNGNANVIWAIEYYFRGSEARQTVNRPNIGERGNDKKEG